MKLSFSDYEYTQKNFEEDTHIIKYFFYRYTPIIPILLIYRDEITSDFYLTALKCRATYKEYNETNASYFAYYFKSLKYCLHNFFRTKNLKKDSQNESLYKNLGEDDFSFENILFDDSDLLEKVEFKEVVSIIETIISDIKNLKTKKIILEFFNCFSYSIVAKKLNCSRQNVEVLVNKFRELLRLKLIDIGYKYSFLFKIYSSKPLKNSEASIIKKLGLKPSFYYAKKQRLKQVGYKGTVEQFFKLSKEEQHKITSKHVTK